VLTTRKRDWDSEHCNIIVNPTFATDTRTAFLYRCGVTGTQFATGGVITNGPASLRNTQFLAGGAPAPFNLGTEVSTATMVGGDGYWNPRGSISTPLENHNAFAHLKYDVSNNTNLWAEASYSTTRSYFYGTSPSFSGTGAFTIFNDNAFLPASIKTLMAAASPAVTSFTLGRISPDWGRNEGVSDLKTYRGAVGFNSDLGGSWNLDGSFDFGHTDGRLENNHSPNQTLLYEAIDAVVNPANGQIVCRSSLIAAGAGRGCVPLNPFGYGSASAGSLDYVFGTGGWSDTTIGQINGEVNLRGSPFALPAGDVSFATGYAWRRLTAEQVSDPLSQALVAVAPNTRGVPAGVIGKLGVFLTGSQSSQPEQTITVNEGYVEVQAPILRDLPLIEALDVNAAARYADYTTTGGVTSWKVGGTWALIDDIRFRATRSRDVRAPNISDLYAPPLGSLGPIINPWTGSNNNTPVYNGGNPNLKPEIAESTTAGVVLMPRFVPGLSLAVDYYKIEINNSIGGLNGGAQTIVNLCFQGNQFYCPYVQRLADNTITGVSNAALNQNNQTNSGIDYEANFKTNVGAVGVNLRALVSWLDTSSTTDPFGRVTEAAGVTGGENGGNTKWQGAVSSTFTYGAWTAFVQERFIASGIYSSNYIVGGRDTQSIDRNFVDGVKYTDVTLRYKRPMAGGSWEAYGTINNLLDQDPPLAPSRIGAPASIIGTNPTLFDVIGRQFNVGIRFNY
jgi:outer membrane receptor protein involved in Fe transport